MNARMRQMQETAAKKAQNLVEARRRKAQSRKAAQQSETGEVRPNNRTANVPSDADLASSHPLSPQLRAAERVEESVLSFASHVQSSEKSEYSEGSTTPLFDVREEPNVLSSTRDSKNARNETVTGDTAPSFHIGNDEDRHERSTARSVPASKKSIRKRKNKQNDAHNNVLRRIHLPSKKPKETLAAKKNPSSKRTCTEENFGLTEDDTTTRKRRSRVVPKRYRD
ncbi:hypothetical protein FGB62_72g06 [Gracilaria domingensis]|nr:hypothetical protein FGB62_72g06 [Gracilaria domingensis]